MADVSYTRVNWQSYPSKATQMTAANLNNMDQGIANCAAAINSANASIVGKVSKAGDTMSGNLTIQRANGYVMWKDMNGNTVRRQVWAGNANSSGDFFLYDNTNNKTILVSDLAGRSIFNGYSNANCPMPNYGSLMKEQGQFTPTLSSPHTYTTSNDGVAFITAWRVGTGYTLRIFVNNYQVFGLPAYADGCCGLTVPLTKGQVLRIDTDSTSTTWNVRYKIFNSV